MKKDFEALLRELAGLYADLLAVSTNLLERLQKGPAETEFQDLIATREEKVVQIARVEEELNTHANATPDPAALEDLRATLEKILAIDEQCKVILNERKGKVADQLKILKQGTSAAKGYKRGNGKGDSGKFISIKE